jgi:hypothetical protein
LEFKTSDELREFILNRQEYDEEPMGNFSPCNGLEWKKDRWIVRVDNKKITEITTKNVPVGFNLKDTGFVMGAMKAMRVGGVDELQNFLKDLK